MAGDVLMKCAFTELVRSIYKLYESNTGTRRASCLAVGRLIM